MSDRDLIIRPVTTLTTTPDLKLDLDGFAAEFGLNDLPRLTVEGQVLVDAPQTPVRILDAGMVARLAEVQGRMFTEERTGTDGTLTCTARGVVGVLNFSGFLSQVSYNWGWGPPALPHTFEHPVSFIQNLNFSVYSPGPSGAELPDDPFSVLEALDKPTGDIAFILAAVIRGMTTSTPPVETGSSAARKAEIRERNQRYIPLLERVLNNSIAKKSTIYTQLADPSFFDAQKSFIVRYITEWLMSGSGNFFSHFLGLVGSFGLIYVPGPVDSSADAGFLARASFLYDQPPVSKVLDSVRCSATIGSRSLPLRQVEVWARGQYWRIDMLNSATESRVYGRYPDGQVSASNGGILELAPPAWIELESPDADLELVPAEAPEAGAEDLDLVQSATIAETRDKRAVQYREISRQLFDEWAKNNYFDTLLAASNLVVEVPFDMSYRVGDNYEFKSADGATLVKGLIAKVTHAVRGGERPTVGTVVHLTYTRFGTWQP